MMDWADGEKWKRPRGGQNGVKLARKAFEKAEAEEEEKEDELESVSRRRQAAFVVVGAWLGVGVVRAVLEMWV